MLNHTPSQQAVDHVWATIEPVLPGLRLYHTVQLMWSLALLGALTQERWDYLMLHLMARKASTEKGTASGVMTAAYQSDEGLTDGVTPSAELRSNSILATQIYQSWLELQAAHADHRLFVQPSAVLVPAAEVCRHPQTHWLLRMQ